jgi:hypothetical protein
MEPPQGPPPGDPDRSPERALEDPGPAGSRFERWDVSMPVPAPKEASPTRSSTVTTAAAILVLIGVFVAAVALVFVPGGGIEFGGSRVSETTALVGLLLTASAYVTAGVLVYRRHPTGRILGILVGVVGLLFGIVQLPSSGAAGLPTLAVNGFLIWALASGGASFRRG